MKAVVTLWPCLSGIELVRSPLGMQDFYPCRRLCCSGGR